LIAQRVVVIAQAEVAVVAQEAEVPVIAQVEVPVVVQELEVVVIAQEVEVALIVQEEVARAWIVRAQVVQRLPVHHPPPTFYQIKHQVSDIPNILIPQRNPFRRRYCGAPPFHR
jgi:predicted metal-dependent phosphoesterase TrpH